MFLWWSGLELTGEMEKNSLFSGEKILSDSDGYNYNSKEKSPDETFDKSVGGKTTKRTPSEDKEIEDKLTAAAILDLSPPTKNPVAELNERLPGLEYKCVDTGGFVHAPMFTMQVTIGGQVFQAEANSKKKAKGVVAQAALAYINEGNFPEEEFKTKRASKNPTTILNEIRPHSKYEYLGELVDDGIRYYKMKLMVGEDEFNARGRSKHLAKSYAAMEALEKLFKLEFNVPDFEQMPTFEGNEEEWRKFKKVKPVILFEGRNPITELHSMYRPMPFDIKDLSTSTSKKYLCAVEIEGVIFRGEGTSRQAAKTLACMDALNYLKSRGLLEQKRAEAAAARELRLAELKREQEAHQALNNLTIG